MSKNQIIAMYNEMFENPNYSPSDFQTIDKANYILGCSYEYRNDPIIHDIRSTCIDLIEMSEEVA